MVKKITEKNFKNFGCVIDHPCKKTKNGRNLFRIILTEKETVGWRIAYLVVRDKQIDRLEQHIDTFESFEPVAGETLLYVAKERNPKKIECFLLDKPVILNKGIWHGVVTLNLNAEIKITENANVDCIYWELGFSLNSGHRIGY